MLLNNLINLKNQAVFYNFVITHQHFLVMGKKLRVGILRETKYPPDRRVPLTPSQIIKLARLYPDVEFIVQPSGIRCFTDHEYDLSFIRHDDDLSNCDILLGVKEVDPKTLIPQKSYLFFAHVGKQQQQNREMLKEIVRKHITLIDYEYLTSEKGERVVAFGRFAGIVGAFNALKAYGLKNNRFNLKPAHQCHDLNELWGELKKIRFDSSEKILITGNGRVSHGALETLHHCNIKTTTPQKFIYEESDSPVVCRIGPADYIRHKRGEPFVFSDFVTNPDKYESAFLPFTERADILITGHYWDPRAPAFFTKEDMKKPGFRLSVIADVSCDINGPIPSTIRATSITDPFYGYDRHLGKEVPAFAHPGTITVMSIDNLPGELPRDASEAFGEQLMQNVLPDLFSGKQSSMIERAIVTAGGKLMPNFSYLNDFLKK